MQLSSLDITIFNFVPHFSCFVRGLRISNGEKIYKRIFLGREPNFLAFPWAFECVRHVRHKRNHVDGLPSFYLWP